MVAGSSRRSSNRRDQRPGREEFRKRSAVAKQTKAEFVQRFSDLVAGERSIFTDGAAREIGLLLGHCATGLIRSWGSCCRLAAELGGKMMYRERLNYWPE